MDPLHEIEFIIRKLDLCDQIEIWERLGKIAQEREQEAFDKYVQTIN